MEIAFRVRGMEVPEVVRHRTRDRVSRLGAQCGTDRAVVLFCRERNPRIAEREVCRITLFGRGRSVGAHAAAREVTVAADRVMAKLARRAARLWGRTTGRRRTARCLPASAGGDGWVSFPTIRSAARREPTGVEGVLGGGEEASGSSWPDRSPGALTPEEAAVEMAAGGRDRLAFVNVETGRPATVFLRGDGEVAVADAYGGAGARGARW